MLQDIEAFNEAHGQSGKSWVDQLAFVERQWGMFFTWMREKYPRRVVVEVSGGVAEVTSQQTPDVEVKIIDHD